MQNKTKLCKDTRTNETYKSNELISTGRIKVLCRAHYLVVVMVAHALAYKKRLRGMQTLIMLYFRVITLLVVLCFALHYSCSTRTLKNMHTV